MPRPKRQRPVWLPACIPFKDGRFLGLAKQTVLAWFSATLALIFFALTLSYATEKTRLSYMTFVHVSSSNTILVLRVLSEAAGVFLGATIHSTFEVVQWVLISRPDGIQLPQFLALQSNTGPLGLLVLAFGRGLPLCQWPIAPRLMSLLRLIAELTVPVLGILVMSNVNTMPVYFPIPGTVQSFAFGMTPFNSTVASQLGVMEDLLFNFGYVSFLANPLHAIDITPKTSQSSSCIEGVGLTTNDSCTRNILLTQEYQNVEANLPFTQHTESEVVLSKNQQIYSLEYKDNIQILEDDLQCQTLGSGPSDYRICIRNADDGWLHAQMIPCPEALIVNNECRENTTWYSNIGFATALKPSFLEALVSYDRNDGRILSHELQTEPTVTSIDSDELIDALYVLLNATEPSLNATDSNPILGSPSHFFGRLVAAHMYRIGKLMETNSMARLRGTNALQSILAITLFYCQDGVLSQTVLPFVGNSSNGTQHQTGAFSQQAKTAEVALAQTRYRIVVGRATLIAYAVLSGITLLICLVALVIGSVLELVRFDAEPTLWPTLDFWTQCRVEDGNGKVVPAHKRVELAWIYYGRELFKEIQGLRVTRRKRKMRDETKDDIELASIGVG